ncbi:hypothetical protein V6N11_006653 [Hibiscus sabdariffa]|uniref:RNase H type-1 domain-containing protein n=1 Tax=Hibiscus sabdariffa TaxID=183260 RepID=A0ABR2RRC6_9ROSI
MLARVWSFGFRRIVVETNNLEVIWVLQYDSHPLSGNGLVASIRHWTKHNWELVIRHIPRTCNMLAAKLSTWGRLNSQVAETFSNPPASLIAEIDTNKKSPLFDSLVP